MSDKSPRHELALRIWIAIVAFMALGNTFACFFGTPGFLQTRLYNGKPNEITPLAARLFGIWTLLAAIVRGYCSMYFYNKVVYDMTQFSFVLAFLHFITELLATGTCELGVGVISPLVVSGVSLIWMFTAQWFIEFEEVAMRRRPNGRSSKKTH